MKIWLILGILLSLNCLGLFYAGIGYMQYVGDFSSQFETAKVTYIQAIIFVSAVISGMSAFFAFREYFNKNG